jgi:hypothetical protein
MGLSDLENRGRRSTSKPDAHVNIDVAIPGRYPEPYLAVFSPGLAAITFTTAISVHRPTAMSLPLAGLSSGQKHVSRDLLEGHVQAHTYEPAPA